MADNCRRVYFKDFVVLHPDGDRFAAIQTTRVNADFLIGEKPAHGQRFRSSLAVPFLLALNRYQMLSGAIVERRPRLDVVGFVGQPTADSSLSRFTLQGAGFVRLHTQRFGELSEMRRATRRHQVLHDNSVSLPGNHNKNRAPTAAERQLGLPLLESLRELFSEIETILAVGRQAQDSLGELGWESVPLRHPSRGGKPEFVAGLKDALSGENRD